MKYRFDGLHAFHETAPQLIRPGFLRPRRLRSYEWITLGLQQGKRCI
jgi:ribosomal protein L37E